MTDYNKQSSKAGLPPGSLIHLGHRKNTKARISVIRFDETEFSEQASCKVDDLKTELLRAGNKWINIDGIHDVELVQQIGDIFKLHPLLLEDIVNTFKRPKYDDYQDYIYLNAKMIGIGEKDQIVSEQIGFVLGQDFILTFQEQEGDIFDTIRERLRENKGSLRSKSIDYLFYRFIDTIVDYYFLVTEHLSEKNEDLEELILKDSSTETLFLIQKSKKELIKIKKLTNPLREAVNSLYRENHPLIQKSTVSYLRNVYEHITQVMEWSDNQREMVGSIMDLYHSEISNKMNQVMKTLTVMATIFIPLTFVSGIYGMNFEHIPELKFKHGYLYFWLLILSLTGAMIYYFKRKKWF